MLDVASIPAAAVVANTSELTSSCKLESALWRSFIPLARDCRVFDCLVGTGTRRDLGKVALVGQAQLGSNLGGQLARSSGERADGYGQS